jgi:dihydrofolate reductase/thymidylate synthase
MSSSSSQLSINEQYKIPTIINNHRPFSLIWACGSNGEFGNNNSIPWAHIKEDMKFFKEKTSKNKNSTDKICVNNCLIMGKNTAESMINPLPNRFNIVLSKSLSKLQDISNLTQRYEDRREDLINTFIYVDNLQSAFRFINECKYIDSNSETFVIGGVNIIYECLKLENIKWLEIIYHTLIEPKDNEKIIADTFIDMKKINELLSAIAFSKFNTVPQEVIARDGVIYNMTINFIENTTYLENEEYKYLNLIKEVSEHGKSKQDRTETGTTSIFGKQLIFNMYDNGFPLFTTKKVFWRGIIEELLFFLSGKTDSKVLEKKKIYIWKDNTTREYLDKYGLTEYKEGELGKGYGYQWRHFGAKCEANEQLELNKKGELLSKENGGFDQIQWVIEAVKEVKANPSDYRGRRMYVSAWNPIDIYMKKIALPCCHRGFQLNVTSDNKLDCLVDLRSNDYC